MKNKEARSLVAVYIYIYTHTIQFYKINNEIKEKSKNSK